MNDLGNYLVTFFLGAAFIGSGAMALRGIISTFSRLHSADRVVRNETARKVKNAVLACALAATLTYGATRLYTEADLRAGNASRYATQTGTSIQLHPSEITFRMLQSWLDWNTHF